jgi:hypothetical protein
MAKDREGKEIFVGSWVKWYDPEEEHRDLNRIYDVYDIVGEDEDLIVLIGDEFSEAEVLPNELLVVQ